MKKLSKRTLEVQEMEKIEGGCNVKLAAIAAGSALVGVFFPPADIVAGAALSAWMGQCL